MTNTVTVDEKNIAKIDMTIPSDLAMTTYKRTLRAYAQNVNIAGFRKGKAPDNIVEKYIGSDKIKAEVIDRLFPQEFQKVIDENKLNVAFHPSINSMEFNLNSDITLQVTVELKPEVKIQSYKDLEIEYDEFKNPENALEQELIQTQKRFSKLEETERESTDKDTVVFDFEGFVGEEKIEHGDAKNYALDLANSNFIPGFAEGLVGHKKDEEFTINVTFPQDYHDEKLKGANAQFKIKINKVQERSLPPLDDELAKKAGKETLDKLKEDINLYLENLEKNENDRIKSDAIFNKVLELTEIKVQDAMLDREYQAIMEETKQSLEQRGGSFDKMVEKEGQDNLEKRFKEEAHKRIVNSLVVEYIAHDANIKMEQKDIMEHINQMAGMYGISAVQLFEQLRKNPNAYASLSQQIIAKKVNKYLLDNNKFTAKIK